MNYTYQRHKIEQIMMFLCNICRRIDSFFLSFHCIGCPTWHIIIVVVGGVGGGGDVVVVIVSIVG